VEVRRVDAGGRRPGDSTLQLCRRLAHTPERPQGLADRIPSDLAFVGLVRVLGSHGERLLERIQGAVEVSGLVARPTEVVEQRRTPVARRIAGT
jgi:hypothetical protein